MGMHQEIARQVALRGGITPGLVWDAHEALMQATYTQTLELDTMNYVVDVYTARLYSEGARFSLGVRRFFWDSGVVYGGEPAIIIPERPINRRRWLDMLRSLNNTPLLS